MVMKQALFKLIKSFLGNAEYGLRPWNYASDELLVLCMHSTPQERAGQFSRLLDFLFTHFSVLNPDQLDDYFTGKLNAGPYILFTFDDGLKNNLMAAELLERRDARAIFFIVPDFIEAVNPRDYYRGHIRQIIDSKVDHEPEDFTPMTVAELSVLREKGHFVESHTMSHLLRSNSRDIDVEREVIQSKKWIADKLKDSARIFCSPIQTNFSVNASAKRLIEKEYDYHFTTFPGFHSGNRNPQLVFRRNIEVHWSLSQIKYALGKADLSRWKDEIARFRQL
jgi:peptidoglycan/xylan/chitin deacetylase (PgdA/CDA1 family)